MISNTHRSPKQGTAKGHPGHMTSAERVQGIALKGIALREVWRPTTRRDGVETLELAWPWVKDHKNIDGFWALREGERRE
jgi:hypothetical protein